MNVARGLLMNDQWFARIADELKINALR